MIALANLAGALIALLLDGPFIAELSRATDEMGQARANEDPVERHRRAGPSTGRPALVLTASPAAAPQGAANAERVASREGTRFTRRAALVDLATSGLVTPLIVR